VGRYGASGTGYALGLVSEKRWTDFGRLNANTYNQSAFKVAKAELTVAKLETSYALAMLTGGGSSLLGLQEVGLGMASNATFEFTYQMGAGEGSFDERFHQVNFANVSSSAVFSNPITQAFVGSVFAMTWRTYDGIGSKNFSADKAINSTLTGGLGNYVGDRFNVGAATPNLSQHAATAFDVFMQTYIGNMVGDAAQQQVEPPKKE
jgi:hypothetical protein